MNLKRRDFIKIGGITAAGSLVIPGFLHSCTGVSLSDNAESYMKHFEVDPDLLNKVISAAMEKGADYADLFFEHTLSNSTGLEDNKVNSAYSNIAYGVGIRVLKGDQTGYAYSEVIDLESMLKAARTAASIANSSAKSVPQDISEFTPPNYYAVKNSWEKTSVKSGGGIRGQVLVAAVDGQGHDGVEF
jgi:TldD protein